MVREKIIPLFLPVLLLLTPYVYFIQFNQYGFNSYEALTLLFVIVFIGLILGLLLRSKVWVVRVITFSLLVTVTLSFFPFFQNGWMIKGSFILAVVLGLFCVDALLTIMSAVFIASSLFLPMKHQFVEPTVLKKTVKVNQQLPTVVHIILDEHIGINAIPTDISEGGALKKQLTNFYLNNGFVLYPNAYSHYSRTYNSIPNLLNFIPKAQNASYFPDGLKQLNLYQNAAFSALSNKGYAIDIFQPQYVNFCAAKSINLEQCYTYPVHSLAYVKHLNISKTQHFIFLSKSFLLMSSVYHAFIIGYEYYLRPALLVVSINLPHWSWHQDQMSSAAVPEVFNRLAKSIIAHPKGRVYFAHILLPHYPYIFNQYCQPNPKVSQWMMNYDLGPTANTDKQRALHYTYYEGQIKCVYQQLNQFMDKLKQAGDFNQTIFIINGDHSSRITKLAPFPVNAKYLSEQDFQDSFATLYATKFPHEAAGKQLQQVPITRLYASTIEEITHTSFAEDMTKNYVYLTVKNPKNKSIMPTLAVSAFDMP